MKKYGDLDSTEFDMAFYNTIKDKIKKDSDFAVVWLSLDDSNKYIYRYEPKKTLTSVLEEKTSPEWDRYPQSLKTLLDTDDEIFSTFFDGYLNGTFLYEEDLITALNYNYYIDHRHNKSNDRITNSTNDIVITEPQTYSRMPFIYSENNYEDFCAYTWNSLYKNSPSVACFKNKFDESYPQPCTFSRIIEGLSCPLVKKSQSTILEEKFKCTVLDRWLIEKIFGINTILELFPVANEYYNHEDNNENIIFPLLNILLKCRPVHIRISIAKIVRELLTDIPRYSRDYSSTPKLDQKVYDEIIIKKLSDDLSKAVHSINLKYLTLLKIFYENKIIPGMNMNCDDTSFLEERHKPKIPNGSKFKLPIDVAIAVLLDYGNTYKLVGELLNSAKKYYNDTDIEKRYSTIQAEVIKMIHYYYKS